MGCSMSKDPAGAVQASPAAYEVPSTADLRAGAPTKCRLAPPPGGARGAAGEDLAAADASEDEAQASRASFSRFAGSPLLPSEGVRVTSRREQAPEASPTELGEVELWAAEGCVWRVGDLEAAAAATTLRRGESVFSPAFALPLEAANLSTWRLFFDPHGADGASLYLAVCDAEEVAAGSGGAALDVTFSLALVISGSGEAEDTTDPTSPVTLQHAFSDASAVWGVQEILRIADLKHSTLAVELQFNSVGGRPTAAPVPRRAVRLEPGAPSVRVLSLEPIMVVLDDFLSAEQCKEIIALAQEDLRRSRVTEGKLSEGRTSSGTFLTGSKGEAPCVAALERRILAAVESEPIRSLQPQALAAVEPLQVVHYTEGEFYTAHFDNRSGSKTRAATFMCYLDGVVGGGCTYFPKAVPVRGGGGSDDARVGIRVQPKRGRALLFWSIRDDKEDLASLHAAEPVTRGDKWICTKWLTSPVPEASP